MPQDIKKYDFIDALRGYAILAVLLVHSSQAVPPANSRLSALMAAGHLGVQLFYIASALTLCLSWSSRKNRESHSTRNFFVRRFFRIAPMFYVSIIAYTLINGLGPREEAPYGIHWWFIPATAMFVHGFQPETINSVVPGGWSIAVEMNFYAILPVFLRVCRSILTTGVALVASLLLFWIVRFAIERWVAPAYPSDQRDLVRSFALFNFSGQLPVFIIGILAYRIFIDKTLLRRATFAGNVLLLPITGIAFLMGTKLAWWIPNYLLAGPVFALLALNLAQHPVFLLVNPLTKLLGKLSFSMYLVHFAVIRGFAWIGFSARFGHSNVASFLHYACLVVVTATISSVTYLVIEHPGIQLGKKWIDRLDGAANRQKATSAPATVPPKAEV